MITSPKRIRVWENKNRGPVKLSTIFEWALREDSADLLLATERPAGKRSFDPEVEQTANLVFGQDLIKRIHARAWPGTKLIGHTGRVYVVHFHEQLAQRMIAIENELFNWRHASPKKLVEDICLFRHGSDYPLFASVTHDKDAYVISAESVPLRGFARTDYGIREMLLAWDKPILLPAVIP